MKVEIRRGLSSQGCTKTRIYPSILWKEPRSKRRRARRTIVVQYESHRSAVEILIHGKSTQWEASGPIDCRVDVIPSSNQVLLLKKPHQQRTLKKEPPRGGISCGNPSIQKNNDLPTLASSLGYHHVGVSTWKK